MPGNLVGGRYQIERQLDQRGFGETFLACDTHMPKRPYCVVKRLRPVHTHPQVLEIAQRLFYKEAEMLAELGEHPQIPRLYAYFTEGGDFYLVQEFIDGHALEREMHEPWPPQKVYDFLVEMLHILEFVHSKGVIHRDIKPANILRRKADGQLVLIDFGAIKEVPQTAMLESGLFTTSIIIGTRGYMAPEQAHGKPRFSSDIYSVGMIAIEALTGKKLRELAENPDTGELRCQEVAPQAGPLLDIISHMTEYAYRERYSSVQNVLADLMNCTPVALPTPARIGVAVPAQKTADSAGAMGNPTAGETQKQKVEQKTALSATELVDTHAVTAQQSVTPEEPMTSRRNWRYWWIALFFVLGLLGLGVIVRAMLQYKVWVMSFLFIGSLLWAIVDARKLGLTRYQSVFAYWLLCLLPGMVVLGMLVLRGHLVLGLFLGWLGAGAGYLMVRRNILRGQAENAQEQSHVKSRTKSKDLV